ncbi:Zinc finger protein NAN [Operophtera brumata]|uniref:Zinc finger protein NAN n=1 Tax=Operophtera brumata TaxID=104452 RepID=A0A0L7KXM0_OPEBR|nr:Zinc finger protein NAN [Operophtera brumata]
MYPAQGKLDYMTELYRYPSNGDDMFQSPTPSASISSFNQSSMAQSSSSPETSPDSFPDLTAHQFLPEFRPKKPRKPDSFQSDLCTLEHCNSQYNHERDDSYRLENAFESPLRLFESPLRPFESHVSPFETRMHLDIAYGSHILPDLNNFVLTERILETPLMVRRHRPIMGRKIMDPEPSLTTINEFPMWQPETQASNSPMQNYTNTYELFPTDNKGYEFPSPIKNSPRTPPNPETSPRGSMSSRMSTPPQSPFSPPPHSPFSPPPRSPFSPPPPSPFSLQLGTPFKEPMIASDISFPTKYGLAKMCTFCRKNGETPLVYMTHTVKQKIGNNKGNNGQPLQSTTVTLKNTRIKSNGRRRY